MDKIARIRQEIERLKETHERNLDKPMERGRIGHAHGYVDCCDELLSFIDSLPDEERPEGIEPYNPGYDEAYLNEKIVKASDTWKGVDVDKYLDEVRGGDKAEHFLGITKMMDGTLDEAAEEYASNYPAYNDEQAIAKYAFKRGAEWQKHQDQETIELAEEHAMLAGQMQMKEEMMKEAVEGEICGRVYDHINVRFADGVCKYLEPKNISHIPADVSKYNIGDKVRIIIVKEENK